MNQSFLNLLSKFVFATASLAICSTALKEFTNVSFASAFTSQGDERILAQQPVRREATPNNLLVPEAVADAIRENLSAQTGTPISRLRIIDAQQQTWPDGCLGLGSPEIVCSKSLVPGWRVIVGTGQQRWIYRTNVSGSVVKLDAIATESLAVTPPPPTRLPQPPARRITTSSRTNQSASSELPQVVVSEAPPNNPEIDSATLENQPVAVPTQPVTPQPEITNRPTQPISPQPEITNRPTQPISPQPEITNRPTQPISPQPEITNRPTQPISPQPEITNRPTTPITTQVETVTPRPEITNRPTQPVTPQPEITNRPTQPVTPRTEPQATAPRRQPSLDRQENSTSEQANFSLTIRQPGATLSDVIARVSLKSKNGNSYALERLIGDYRYRLNQQGLFRGGMKAGDRIVVRLYDSETKSLIGWSEFELLPQNAAVNLIFSIRPFLHRMVRTIYATDANADGNIDVGKNVYDYYTQVVGTQPGQERVLFLKAMQDSNLNWFQIAGFPVPPRSSVYPNSFALGEDNLTVTAFSAGLPRNITAIPGQENRIITVNTNNNSYDVTQLLSSSERTRTNRSNQSVAPESQISFADVSSNHWARSYIGQLVAKKILEGFPDGLYRPNAPVTRAEFASILRKAFDRDEMRDAVAFKDVPTNHWAYPAIRQAYEMGFLDTDRNLAFNPDQKVSRLDVLVALGKGLNYSTNVSTEEILRVYRDASGIPSGVRNIVAAVTQRDMVVSYPNVKFLYPDRVATRAEIAAFIYRALVSTGQADDIVSPYVVVVANTTNNNSELRQTPPPQETPATPARRRSNNLPEGVRRTTRQGGSDNNNRRSPR